MASFCCVALWSKQKDVTEQKHCGLDNEQDTAIKVSV